MRDTDADWKKIAELHPHYGVLTNPAYHPSQLTDESLEKFYAGGHVDVDFVVKQLRGRWPDFAPRVAIDFGCGVGRLAVPMCKYADEVTGVDIAPGMLEVARGYAEKSGVNLNLTDEIPAKADWVNSSIVFQHIPPRRGMALVQTLLNALPVGGFASLQFALYRAPGRIAELGHDAQYVCYDGDRVEVLSEALDPDVGMRMYDYAATRVLAAFFNAGLIDPFLLHTDHGGHHGAWFFGRKHG
jgi:SAM-dependent methyltransferase